MLIVTLLVVITTTGYAAPRTKHCPPTCKHRQHASTQPAPCTASDTVYVVTEVRVHDDRPAVQTEGAWSEVLNCFELSAGFRWENAHECPASVSTPHPTPAPPRVTDPFYLGAAIRLPLAERVAAFGSFDRDWVDAAHFQARAGLSFTPFARRAR